MKTVGHALETMALAQRKFLQKGGLCVGLHITRVAMEKGLPLDPLRLRTAEGGQVEGLGKARIQKILAHYNITKILAEESGRTSRGGLGLMETYVGVLNGLASASPDALEDVMGWWISKVRLHFSSEGPRFAFDSGKSVESNLRELFRQAEEIQKNSGGANYAGAMLQHLVGAKLDLILDSGTVTHHGFSVADHSTARNADFHINGVAIHVTTHPGEGVIRKVAANLRKGLKPLIITTSDGVAGARYLLKNTEWADRVDVLDAAQFFTANIYERSLFHAGACQVNMAGIIGRYNEIVEKCEVDPVLRIRLD